MKSRILQRQSHPRRYAAARHTYPYPHPGPYREKDPSCLHLYHVTRAVRRVSTRAPRNTDKETAFVGPSHRRRKLEVEHLASVAYSRSHSGAEATTSSQQQEHRRRTSRGLHVPPEGLRGQGQGQGHGHPSPSPTRTSFGGATFYEEDEEDHRQGYGQGQKHMSLDRSPSPQRSGGWASPGLTIPDDGTNGRSRSPAASKVYGDLNGGPGSSVSWASAKAGSARVNGYPRYQSQNEGFFTRHYRKMSEGLPYFAHGGQEDRFAEKEKLGRGRSAAGGVGRFSFRELPRRMGLLISRRRKPVAVVLLFVLGLMIWFNAGKSAFIYPLHPPYPPPF